MGFKMSRNRGRYENQGEKKTKKQKKTKSQNMKNTRHCLLQNWGFFEIFDPSVPSHIYTYIYIHTGSHLHNRQSLSLEIDG